MGPLLRTYKEFTCLLYALKASSTKINDLRYHLFCAKKGEVESHQLPPCRDCLVKHAKRANYQAGIWRRCLEQDPQVPSPVTRDQQLVVDWMGAQPAPVAILDLLACNCSVCIMPCMANGLQTAKTRLQPQMKKMKMITGK